MNIELLNNQYQEAVAVADMRLNKISDAMKTLKNAHTTLRQSGSIPGIILYCSLLIISFVFQGKFLSLFDEYNLLFGSITIWSVQLYLAVLCLYGCNSLWKSMQVALNIGKINYLEDSLGKIKQGMSQYKADLLSCSRVPAELPPLKLVDNLEDVVDKAERDTSFLASTKFMDTVRVGSYMIASLCVALFIGILGAFPITDIVRQQFDVDLYTTISVISVVVAAISLILFNYYLNKSFHATFGYFCATLMAAPIGLLTAVAVAVVLIVVFYIVVAILCVAAVLALLSILLSK